MTTRDEILHRARTGWPPGTVPYSQSSARTPTGHRADCSGYVSMCLGLATPGLSTVTLVDVLDRLPSVDDLRPGDVILDGGPGSGGDEGHVILFEAWLNDDPNDSRYWGWEQAGGINGPVRRIINYPDDGYGGPWSPYRLRGITEGGAEDMSQRASNAIEAWSVGAARASDGYEIAPVIWQQRMERWQVDVSAQIAAQRSELQALTAAFGALAAGGTSVDTSAVLAAVAEVRQLVEREHAAELAAARAEVEARTQNEAGS